MITNILLALLVLAPQTPAQRIDKAGRVAFAALRDFQTIELTAFHTHASWPSTDQHADIVAKLAIARECIDDSLVHGAALVPGAPAPAPVLSLLRNEAGAVAALNGLVGPNAPAAARKAINRVQDAFAALIDLFPIGDRDGHPPARPQ